MVIKRITRDRRLTPDEAAKYKKIREQIAAELPELVARHLKRTMESGANEEQEKRADDGQG